MVTEIVAKFGAAMKGFWWGLEDQERMMVVSGLIYAAWIFAAMFRAREVEEQKELERRQLASAIAEELIRRG